MRTITDRAFTIVLADLEDDRVLRDRIVSEFREMPGWTLTLRQACRLFSLEPATCERVLCGLVDCGALAKDGCAFARAAASRRSF